jgi:hypothetical protein
MTRRRKHVVLIALAASIVAGASVTGGLLLSSRSAHAGPSAAAGDRLSPLEAAQIRAQRHGKFSEPAADAVLTVHAKQTVNGKEWKIVSYRSKSGELCAGVTWPGEGQDMTCAPRASWFAHGPLYVEPGAQQDAGHPENWARFVLNGMVDLNRAQSVELVNTDCSTENVPVDSAGLFLTVIESDAIQRGVWPYMLVAHGPNGRIVQKVPVEARAPDTDAARAAGQTAPTPSAACA